jgi:hypothetical protein
MKPWTGFPSLIVTSKTRKTLIDIIPLFLLNLTVTFVKIKSDLYMSFLEKIYFG